jgi:hypothetical protein
MSDSVLDAYKVRLEAAAFRLAREHEARRRRRVIWTAVIATALLATTTALASAGVLGGWLGGKPAPAEVSRDFAGIPSELGHTTDPKMTSEVAREGEIGVYATPTLQGGYCLVADDPILGFDGDGRGYCLKPAAAKRRFVAGLIGGARDQESGQRESVVAGRVLFDGAATIRLTDPHGHEVQGTLGTGGFFVALVATGDIRTCIIDGKAWTSTLVVSDRQGRELGRAAFPFWVPARDTHGERLHACGFLSPMGDDLAARIIREEGLR